MLKSKIFFSQADAEYGYGDAFDSRADKKVVVKLDLCPQDHPCPSVDVCPVRALSQKGNDAPEVNMKKCIKCGKCVDYCPKRAIVFE